MSKRGTKSAQMRKDLIKSNQTQNEFSPFIQEHISDLKRQQEKKSTITSPTILDAGNEGKRRKQRLLDNETKAGLTEEHTFHPKVTSAQIPNFKKLQKSFQDKLASKKSQKPPTIPIPFPNVEKHQKESLEHTNEIKNKIHSQIQQTMTTHFKATKYYHSIIPPHMMIQDPPKPTKAWKLTCEHKKQLAEAEKQDKEMQLKEQEAKAQKVKELSMKLRAKLQLYDTQSLSRNDDNHKKLIQGMPSNFQEYSHYYL